MSLECGNTLPRDPEIVHCADCVHFQQFDVPNYGSCSLREIGDVVTRVTDFCSYAIRRDSLGGDNEQEKN